MPNIPLISFNTGEVTPQIDSRADIEKYASSCRELKNMLPRIYGGVERRPGTEFIKEAKNSPEGIRLIPFVFSSTIAYMCEFGNLYARFYFDGAPLLDGSSNHVEVTTPYLAADLAALQFGQIGDTLWLVHRDYAPRKLTRTTTTSFSLDTIAFTTGPFRKRNDIANDDDITLSSDVTAADAVGTLTASDDVFDSDHVGAIFKLTQPRATTIVTIDAAGTSDVIDVFGNYTWETTGTWTGTIKLERNVNSAGWETFRTKTSKDNANTQLSKTEVEDNVQFRITIVAGVTGDPGSNVSLDKSTQDGIVRIDAVFSATVATITVLSKLAETDTTIRWAEGSWSSVRGYPQAFTFFENRAVYGSTATQSATIWFSAEDKYENFRADVKASDSFEVPITTTNEIRWLASLDALTVGTSGDEWRVASNKLDTPITPTSFSAKQQSRYGSSLLQSVKVNDVVLFTDFVRRKVREFTFSEQRSKYVAPDLTALAEHITASGITSMAHQRNPDSILWSTLADGTLLSMTYEREQDVVAWARHFGPSTDYPFLRLLSDNRPTEPDDLVANIHITNATDLQNMTGSNRYILDGDIDLDSIVWTPITGFSGVLDGNGFTISNFVISAPTSDEQGLFADIDGTGIQVRDITFQDCSVSGQRWVAILVGKSLTANPDKVLTCKDVHFVDCTVTAATFQAGLIFGGSFIDMRMWRCTATNCVVTAQISAGMMIGTHGGSPGGNQYVDSHVIGGTVDCTSGGKCGGFVGSGGDGVLVHTCSSTATVTGTGTWVGGFGGTAGLLSTYYSCYAKGDVTGLIATGGFLGGSNSTSYNNCYATGDVVGTDQVGGFTGNDLKADFKDCYATGSVTGTSNVGCFIGFASSSTTFEDITCRLGTITGTDPDTTGGFVGAAGASTTAVNTYWDTSNSTQTDSDLGEGKTTDELLDYTTYIGWDFKEKWYNSAGVISVAVMPGTDEDEVWVAVHRTINDESKTYIERMKPRVFSSLPDAFFVDSGATVTNSPASTTIAGLTHLIGETVVVNGDGVAYTPAAVVDSSGEVTISVAVSVAQVGLPARYVLQPMRPDIPIDGTTSGSVVKVAEMAISFLDTVDAKFGVDLDNLFTIDWFDSIWENKSIISGLFSGLVIANVDGGYSVENNLIISANGPMPCTVRAIIPRMSKTGR